MGKGEIVPGGLLNSRIFGQALGMLGRALIPKFLLKDGTCNLDITQPGGCPSPHCSEAPGPLCDR